LVSAFFCIWKDLNLKKAKAVKKAACGRFFRLLVRRRVLKRPCVSVAKQCRLRSNMRVLLPAPRRNKRKLARSDFFIKIGTHLNRCSSFSEKGHGKSLGSLINALAVALLPTNLFRFSICGRCLKIYNATRTTKRAIERIQFLSLFFVPRMAYLY